eukprot:2103893-Pyramimonas_sp.AAC.1
MAQAWRIGAPTCSATSARRWQSGEAPGLPWGDFNIAPPELNDSIWPRALNAQVVAAENEAPTRFPAEGAARCLDHAPISTGLAPQFDELELIRTVPRRPRIGA